MKLLTLGLAVPLFVAAAPAAGAQEAPKAPEALQVGADAQCLRRLGRLLQIGRAHV